MILCTFYSTKTLENKKHQKSQYFLADKSIVIHKIQRWPEKKISIIYKENINIESYEAPGYDSLMKAQGLY